MRKSGFRVRAAVCMRPAESLPVVRPLRAGWSPVIFFQGQCYPGRVLECEKPIEPGEAGEAVIAIMASQAENLGLQEDSVFELRDGPTSVIAAAIVLSYSESDILVARTEHRAHAALQPCCRFA